MRKKRGSYEPSLTEISMDLAWWSPTAGFIACTLFLILSSIFRSLSQSTDIGWMFLGTIFSIAFLTLAGVVFVVSLVAFIRDEFFGRK